MSQPFTGFTNLMNLKKTSMILPSWELLSSSDNLAQDNYQPDNNPPQDNNNYTIGKLHQLQVTQTLDNYNLTN